MEVGSLNINGSVKRVIESLAPSSYLGVDIESGEGVDEICDVKDLIDCYGKESFDVVVSTELLEHVRSWRKAVSNFKNLLRPGGILLITTRSKGFHYHGYPLDFWRFEPCDIEAIFPDLSIEVVEKDPLCPGIFAKMRKPSSFIERNVSSYKLFSMVRGKHCVDIRNFDILIFKLKWRLKLFLRQVEKTLEVFFKKRINFFN